MCGVCVFTIMCVGAHVRMWCTFVWRTIGDVGCLRVKVSHWAWSSLPNCSGWPVSSRDPSVPVSPRLRLHGRWRSKLRSLCLFGPFGPLLIKPLPSSSIILSSLSSCSFFLVLGMRIFQILNTNIFLSILFLWGKILLCSSGWPQTCNPPTSASQCYFYRSSLVSIWNWKALSGSTQEQRNSFALPLPFCSIQTLQALGGCCPHRWGWIFLTQYTDSNANLFRKHPHRHTQRGLHKAGIPGNGEQDSFRGSLSHQEMLPSRPNEVSTHYQGKCPWYIC